MPRKRRSQRTDWSSTMPEDDDRYEPPYRDRDPRDRDPREREPAYRSTSTPTKPTSAFANPTTLAVLGGVFLLGIGLGIGFSSATTSGPQNIASREAIDRAAPNPELCAQFGASAIAMDTRVFLTLNPFNVYLSQPKMQPACVLRQNNWAVLEQRKLVNSEQVRDCKNRMNTFGFTGQLEDKPEISCIYQNDAAQNLFLNQPGGVVAPPPTDNQF